MTSESSILRRLDQLESETRSIRRELETQAKPEPNPKPSQTQYKPEDLIGKLCWVWDYDEGAEKSPAEIIAKFHPNSPYPWITTLGSPWENAEPVSREFFEAHCYESKPKYIIDWSNLPNEARFIARDNDGYWYWYEEEPVHSNDLPGYWKYTSTKWSDIPVNESRDYPDLPWDKSLIERP